MDAQRVVEALGTEVIPFAVARRRKDNNRKKEPTSVRSKNMGVDELFEIHLHATAQSTLSEANLKSIGVGLITSH